LKPIAKTSSNYTRKTVREFEASFSLERAWRNYKAELKNNRVLLQWKRIHGVRQIVQKALLEPPVVPVLEPPPDGLFIDVDPLGYVRIALSDIPLKRVGVAQFLHYPDIKVVEAVHGWLKFVKAAPNLVEIPLRCRGGIKNRGAVS